MNNVNINLNHVLNLFYDEFSNDLVINKIDNININIALIENSSDPNSPTILSIDVPQHLFSNSKNICRLSSAIANEMNSKAILISGIIMANHNNLNNNKFISHYNHLNKLCDSSYYLFSLIVDMFNNWWVKSAPVANLYPFLTHPPSSSSNNSNNSNKFKYFFNQQHFIKWGTSNGKNEILNDKFLISLLKNLKDVSQFNQIINEFTNVIYQFNAIPLQKLLLENPKLFSCDCNTCIIKRKQLILLLNLYSFNKSNNVKNKIAKFMSTFVPFNVNIKH